MTTATERRIAKRRAEIMPLDAFPEEYRKRIEEQVASPTPPPKWFQHGFHGDRRPLAQWISRAWLEWHWARGIDPEYTERIPEWMRQHVIRRDQRVCQLCDDDEPIPDDKPLHIDHKIPRSKGGPTTVDNLQVAHPACNIAKGAGD